MLQRIYFVIFGYLIISLRGRGSERFINLCGKHNIYLRDIKSAQNYIRLKISVKDFRKIKPLLRKSQCRVHITERHGVPFFIYRYRNRKTFVFSFLLAWVLIYLSTLFIWDINIEGEDYYTKQEIINYIKTNYIMAGTLKKNVNCFEIEKILRNKYDKIGWISCDIKGTQFNVVISETVDTDSIRNNDEPCDIVAIKDCKIDNIIIRAGSPMVKKNQEVKKGDILISGVIPIKGDFDVLLDTAEIAADGEIYGISDLLYEDSFNLDYYKKVYTKNMKKQYNMNFINKSIKIFPQKVKYANYDTVFIDKKIKLGRTFYLPLSFTVKEYYEYIVKRKMLSEKEAISIANKRLDKYINDLKQKKVEILENNVKINIIDGKCISKGYLKISEPVGIPNSIDRSIFDEQGDKDENDF